MAKVKETASYLEKEKSIPFSYHVNTSNTSFIKVHDYLKRKEVKNNKFFLKLFDPGLAKINPFGEHLTQVQEERIIREIVRNPFYFIREIVRVEVAGKTIPFELHPGNLAAVWSVLNSFNFSILLPRQRYKTVSIAAALAWVYDFGTENSHMMFHNKSLKDAINNLKRLKDIRFHYPKFLKKYCNKKADIDNQQTILNSRTKNHIDVKGNPQSDDDADKQGKHTWLCINTLNCWDRLLTQSAV